MSWLFVLIPVGQKSSLKKEKGLLSFHLTGKGSPIELAYLASCFRFHDNLRSSTKKGSR